MAKQRMSELFPTVQGRKRVFWGNSSVGPRCDPGGEGFVVLPARRAIFFAEDGITSVPIGEAHW